MHKSPLFSADQLARLIENYPREHYSLVQTGARGSGRVWREGEIGNLSGRQVIDAISRGGLWLNMRDVGAVDRRYRDMLDGMFEEVAAKVPGFECERPSGEHPDLRRRMRRCIIISTCRGRRWCRSSAASGSMSIRTRRRS